MTNKILSTLLILIIILLSAILSYNTLKIRTGIANINFNNEKGHIGEKIIIFLKPLIFLIYSFAFYLSFTKAGGIFVTLDSILYIATSNVSSILIIIVGLLCSNLLYPRKNNADTLKVLLNYFLAYLGSGLFISYAFQITRPIVEPLINIYILVSIVYSAFSCFILPFISELIAMFKKPQT